MRLVPVTVLLLMFSLSGLVAAEERAWTEVRSPHFRVITNGDQSDGRLVLRHFELMRSVFASQFPRFKLDAPAPLLILAARDESTMRKLLPEFSSEGIRYLAGMYRHGWEREYAIVRLDIIKENSDALATVYHEYVHSLLHVNMHVIPSWLDEGMAQFYAYTGFQGDRMYIGAAPNHWEIRTLYGMQLIPFEKFINSGMWQQDEFQTREYYMQAWGLTHFLMLSPAMDSGQRLSKFLQLIQQGQTPQKKAFQEAIGNFEGVQKAYEQYIHKFTFPARELPAPTKPDEKQFVARTLDPGETEAELAAWYIRFHLWDPMRQMTAAALLKGPKLSLAHEDSGFLLYNEGHDADALKEFSSAVDLDGRNYIALFAKTEVAQELSQKPDSQLTFEQLNQVIDLNADFAPAYVQLAKLDAAKGDLRLALAMSRKAQHIEPFRPSYHLLSARLLLMMNRPAEAAAEASFVAEHWRGSNHDSAIEILNQIPESEKHAENPAFYDIKPLDPSWKTAEGMVKEVRCKGRDFAITLEGKGTPETYKTQGFPVVFSDTLWVGMDHFTPCYHVQGLRAVLKYKPSKDASYGGDLVFVAFRDDLLPQPSAPAAQASTK